MTPDRLVAIAGAAGCLVVLGAVTAALVFAFVEAQIEGPQAEEVG